MNQRSMASVKLQPMHLNVQADDYDHKEYNDMERAGRLKSALQEYSQVYDEI